MLAKPQKLGDLAYAQRRCDENVFRYVHFAVDIIGVRRGAIVFFELVYNLRLGNEELLRNRLHGDIAVDIVVQKRFRRFGNVGRVYYLVLVLRQAVDYLEYNLRRHVAHLLVERGGLGELEQLEEQRFAVGVFKNYSVRQSVRAQYFAYYAAVYVNPYLFVRVGLVRPILMPRALG